MAERRTVVLVVLDGWGVGPEDESNPIHSAEPENFEYLKKHYPLTTLEAAGINVGLPWGETGNSEVGHVAIGSGKIMYQHYPRISLTIRDGSFFENPALLGACKHVKKTGGVVNLIGLLTKANTHASLEHLKALITLCEKNQAPYKLQLFGDGKDSPPGSIRELLAHLPQDKVATLMGRYYGMDRDQNWSLTRSAYEILTQDTNVPDKRTPLAVAEETLSKKLLEEYIPPARFSDQSAMRSGDAMIFFNFREDSIRQLADAFILPEFDRFPRAKLENVYIATMTRYSESYQVPVAYPPEQVEQPLGQIIAEAGRVQLRLAETYKYAHVTFFFNGFREPPFENEYRVLVPSLQTPHPEEHPELSAPAITDRLTEAIRGKGFDFILVNYANADTIGHTGNYEAAVQTVKVLDAELGKVLQAAGQANAIVVITADHGNVERIFNATTGRPETGHDPSPVPFCLVAPEYKGRRFYNSDNLQAETAGNLADVAPTILEIMGLSQPPEMTGKSLLSSLL